MAWTSVADFERDFDKATGCLADQLLGFQHALGASALLAALLLYTFIR